MEEYLAVCMCRKTYIRARMKAMHIYKQLQQLWYHSTELASAADRLGACGMSPSLLFQDKTIQPVAAAVVHIRRYSKRYPKGREEGESL